MLVAHIDSVPPAPGADDNASGVGTLVALAPRLQNAACDVWLIATGAEERPYTGQADHLGALAAVPRVKRRRGDLRFVLSLDEVGRGSTFHLRSRANRPGVEGRIVRAGRGAVRWVPDTGTRQLRPPRVLARRAARGQARRPGRPAAATPRATPPARLQPRSFVRVRAIVERLLG